MKFYFVFLFVAILFAYLAQTQGQYVIGIDGAEERYHRSRLFVVLLLILFCFAYTFRWRVGTDFSGYYYGYDSYAHLKILDCFKGRDWAFSLLGYGIYKIAPGNHQFYFFILSLLTYVPVVWYFNRHADNFTFIIFLYITMLSCFWPYNGSRQSIAVSFCLLALESLNDKKYLLSAFLVLVASAFHVTAFIFIPLGLFLKLKPWSKVMCAITAALLLSVIFLGNLWAVIIGFLEYVGQTKLVNDYGGAIVGRGGVNILRIIVAVIPAFLGFIMYYQDPDSITEENGVFINMAVMVAVFMAAASRLNVLARFGIYFTVGVPLVYNEFERVLNDESQILYETTVCICYLVYMVTLLPVESNLVPYKFIFMAH